MSLEVVATFTAPGVAHLAKARLESAGIHSVVVGEDMSSLTGVFAPEAHGVKLCVDPADAESARALLDHDDRVAE